MKHRTHIDLSLGDAIDRVSILARKIYFGEEGAYKEFEYLTQSIDKLKIQRPRSGSKRSRSWETGSRHSIPRLWTPSRWEKNPDLIWR